MAFLASHAGVPIAEEVLCTRVHEVRDVEGGRAVTPVAGHAVRAFVGILVTGRAVGFGAAVVDGLARQRHLVAGDPRMALPARQARMLGFERKRGAGRVVERRAAESFFSVAGPAILLQALLVDVGVTRRTLVEPHGFDDGRLVAFRARHLRVKACEGKRGPGMVDGPCGPALRRVA